MQNIKVLIYGAGNGGDKLADEFLNNSEPYDVVAFVDKAGIDTTNGEKTKRGKPVILPDEINEQDYDMIFIATIDTSVPTSLSDIYGIPLEKINQTRFFSSHELAVRLRALENFADLCTQLNITGAVAEVGVYRGDFAKDINRVFPDRELYLYDTFSGFEEQDTVTERTYVKERFTHYSDTSEELVLSKFANPENVVIRKGCFPDTIRPDEENKEFCFVSLDADLYNPTIAGLRFFYPRLANGGIIFVHDYWNVNFGGVKRAVVEFICEHDAPLAPIGDFRTVALAKPYSKGDAK